MDTEYFPSRGLQMNETDNQIIAIQCEVCLQRCAWDGMCSRRDSNPLGLGQDKNIDKRDISRYQGEVHWKKGKLNGDANNDTNLELRVDVRLLQAI